MSIVSFSRKYIFIKTRKTAGTSIQKTLLPFCNMHDIVTKEWTNLLTGQLSVIEEFATLEQIENLFGINHDNYFKFGFTRNPFALTLSRYFYQIKMGRIAGPPLKEQFNNWVSEVYFVGEPGFPKGRYIKDRSRLLLFNSTFKPKVNFIGRFETLKKDFQHVIKQIGLPKIELVHVNKSNIHNVMYRDWLSEHSKKLIEKNFDFELEYFKYKY